MNRLKLRFAQSDERPFTEWLATTRRNDLDPAILKYPTLRILCAYDGEPEAYMPTQLAVVLESLAIKPGIEAKDYIEAIRTLAQGVTLMASNINVREIYFIVSDEGAKNVALNHGFEEVKHPVLRMKL